MSVCRYPMQEDEKELGTWAATIIIPDTGYYHVDLTITTINIILLGEFDIYLSSIIDLARFESHGADQYMIIARKNIVKITTRESVISKRITIMTRDNNEFIIDHGLLSCDDILEALKK